MNFSEYLTSKKIDEKAFSTAEPDMFRQWQMEFDQMHENSFTIQKLNLINPIRRKYQLKEAPTAAQKTEIIAPSIPKVAKPVFKPKPKL